jgi:PAS domain S-box-containing protein
MSDITTMTKAALIEEIRRLRRQYEDCSEANGSNGKFDEEALFAFAGEGEGDEMYVVTETGRFVFVNDAALARLGYTAEEMLAMSMPRIDPAGTRAAWLARVSRMKQNDEPDVFETEYVDREGKRLAREVTARYISYRSRNYVLCIARGIERMEGKSSPASADRTREHVLFKVTSDGVIVVDTRGNITESNAVADRLLGVPKSEIIGRSCVDARWRLVDAGGEPIGIASHPLMIAMVEEEIISNRRISMMPLDGAPRAFMINAAPLYDEQGSLAGAIGCVRPFEDINERKDEIHQQRVRHALHREVVEALLESDSEDMLERRVCETLVRHGNYALVWRGVTKSTDERFYPGAVAGEAADYLMRVKIRYDDSEFGNGPLGRAYKTGEMVLVQDMEMDESYTPWRDQAKRIGLHSLVAFPLLHDGEKLGVFACYASGGHHFSEAEVRHLGEITQLLAFGIGMRRRIERDRNLRGEFETLRTIADGYEELLPVAVARFARRDPFRCESANERFSTLLDEPYHSIGATGYYASDFMHAIYHRDLYRQLATVASSSEAAGEDDVVFADWEGREMRWSWRILPVTGEGGEEQLVYIACRVEALSGQAAVTSREEIPDGFDDPAVLHIASPRLGPRSKPETKLARFLDEGRILRINRAASTLFAIDGDVSGRKPEALFGEHMHAALTNLLTVKDIGSTVNMPSPDGSTDVAFAVYPFTAEDAQEFVLIQQ